MVSTDDRYRETAPWNDEFLDYIERITIALEILAGVAE